MRAAALLAPIALLALGPHLALWGLPETPFPTDPGSILLFCGAFVLGVVLHEGLHGLGHVWGEATWDDVRFGMHWKALAPFAQCTVPTRARAYRVALALPGLVLGIGPLALGVSTGIWLATFYGFLMLVAAAGDLLILWVLRGVPPRVWVQDHPRQVGCLVVAGAESSSPAPVSKDELPDDTTDEAVVHSSLGACGPLRRLCGHWVSDRARLTGASRSVSVLHRRRSARRLETPSVEESQTEDRAANMRG